MKHEPEDRREFELLDELDAGNPSPGSPKEERIVSSHQWIRSLMRTSPVPPIRATQLANRLHDEMHGSPHPSRWQWVYSLLQRPLVPAGATLILLCICLSGTMLTLPRNEISLTHRVGISSTNEFSGWEHWWAERGYPIRIGNHTATLTLQDGSTVECMPRSIVRVSPSDSRTLHLDRGEVTVHAISNPEHPLIVSTQLGDVRVIGTVFRVRLIP